MYKLDKNHPQNCQGGGEGLDVELPVDRELLLASIVIRTHVAAAGMVPTGPSGTYVPAPYIQNIKY